MTRPPSTSGSSLGFDVEPSELNTVAKSVALQQGMLHKAANDLVYDLVEFMDCGGYGTAAEMVSTAYVKVGNRFLDVWAKTVTGVGGVAVGFVTTANNYSMAEAASHPSGNAPPVQFPLPQVIDTPPRYQRIPDPKWGDMDDYSSGLISWLLEGVPDWAMDIVRDLFDNVYRWGKAGDILPLPDYLQLDKIALAWLKPGFAITQIESTLTWTIGSISDPNNGEWQAAMRQFASSLWGTTAWGTSTAGYEWKHDSAGGQGAGSHPVMSVLWDTTQEVSQIMRAYAEAGEKMGREVARVYREAVWDALPDIADGLDMNDVKKIGKGILGLGRELGIGITLKIDTGAINAAVSLYEGELLGLTSDLNRLIPALDEAYRSAPTYHSEEARSQAFGARSLNEFKPEHHFSVPGQDPDDMYYPMDLAAQEGMFGSHPIDKHVGLADDQMIMRLRDQPNVPDASSFTDLSSAQKYTQDVLRDDANENRIAAWIDSVEKKVRDRPGYNPNRSEIQPPLYLEFSGQSVGRTVSRAEYDANGMSASAEERDWVQVRLIYKEGLEPPFIVLTAMPHAAP
ncbi:RNase A-like domain-containing protein [Streptomyces sp. ITFR-6]|uniref:RNase A-like domain-containing protein n=1 Tax=Streptomyces sp. ITFR-6 TaxID=3075197 RepID=UPI00288ADDB7|nr:RNase A-like domain-containing protein [Streptomyces sp. ITFR-6]WNI29962.1 RNase A-like domain-containing protein [Streptomyces sp. ITFR-6]